MNLRRALLCLLLLLPTCAYAGDKATFSTFNWKGAKIATTTVAIDKPKGGYRAQSATSYADSAKQQNRTVEYLFDKDGLATSTWLSLLTDKTNLIFTPGKTRDKLEINNTQGTTFLGSGMATMAKPDYTVVFPDDPAAWQAFLDLAATHPHSDGSYTLYMAPAKLGVAGQIEIVQLGHATEATGTLDGKPVALKCYELTLSKGKSRIYTDPEGKLMLADMSSLGFKHVRAKFDLTK